MENPIIKDGYAEIKKRAEEIYEKFGRIWCPAIDEYVAFYKSGLHHLTWKGNLPRSKSDQRRRFALLPRVRSILEDPTSIVEHEEDVISHTTKTGSERILAQATARFWRITEVRDGETVTVVIRQIENHEKHFFSVFAKKQKTAP